MMRLLGLPLCEATTRLEKENLPYRITIYHSYKPYEQTDSKRVIRAQLVDGTYELVVSEFKTELNKTSQG